MPCSFSREPAREASVTTEYMKIEGGVGTRKKLRFGYMIEALLKSRRSAGLETGCHRPDEDVNMYLASLLCRYAERCDVHADYIVPYESDLFERVQDAGECRAKYMIYRHNADHLLLSLGLFGNAWLRNEQENAFAWAPDRNTVIGRGKNYYSMASTYATRLGEGRRGLDEIMAKLEIGFEDYLTILETLRGEQFNLRQIFTIGEWYHFCKELGVSPGGDSATGPSG
jgi:hypothetical protein